MSASGICIGIDDHHHAPSHAVLISPGNPAGHVFTFCRATAKPVSPAVA
jgi:hypothetical protein